MLLLNTIASFTEGQKNAGLGDMVTWQLDISGLNLMSTRAAVDVRQCEGGGGDKNWGRQVEERS